MCTSEVDDEILFAELLESPRMCSRPCEDPQLTLIDTTELITTSPLTPLVPTATALFGPPKMCSIAFQPPTIIEEEPKTAQSELKALCSGKK
jgi:hypothetical protein